MDVHTRAPLCSLMAVNASGENCKIDCVFSVVGGTKRLGVACGCALFPVFVRVRPGFGFPVDYAGGLHRHPKSPSPSNLPSKYPNNLPWKYPTNYLSKYSTALPPTINLTAPSPTNEPTTTINSTILPTDLAQTYLYNEIISLVLLYYIDFFYEFFCFFKFYCFDFFYWFLGFLNLITD